MSMHDVGAGLAPPSSPSQSRQTLSSSPSQPGSTPPSSPSQSPTYASVAGGNQPLREITLGKAIWEALAEELRRDPTVFIIGEDVAEAGTAFKVLTGLVQEFGPRRIID